jgi:hypothetical protein
MSTARRQRFSFETEIAELPAELEGVELISPTTTGYDSAPSEMDGTCAGLSSPSLSNFESAPSESAVTDFSSLHSNYDSAVQEKLRLNIETLSRLEGENASRPSANHAGPSSPQRSTVSVSKDDVDWNAPPPYQVLGNEKRNVSTAVLSMDVYIFQRRTYEDLTLFYQTTAASV